MAVRPASGWCAVTAVLDLQPGDVIAHRGGWFTLAARPVPSRQGATVHLLFVGGSKRSVHWLAHLTTKPAGEL